MFFCVLNQSEKHLGIYVGINTREMKPCNLRMLKLKLVGK